MDATKPLRRQHSLRTMKRKNRKQDNVCSLLLCSPASPESLSHSNYHAKYIWNEPDKPDGKAEFVEDLPCMLCAATKGIYSPDRMNEHENNGKCTSDGVQRIPCPCIL